MSPPFNCTVAPATAVSPAVTFPVTACWAIADVENKNNSICKRSTALAATGLENGIFQKGKQFFMTSSFGEQLDDTIVTKCNCLKSISKYFFFVLRPTGFMRIIHGTDWLLGAKRERKEYDFRGISIFTEEFVNRFPKYTCTTVIVTI
jgi:hypothetical protein